VLDAALVVMEARGLDGVSMRAVAERIGVTPMALYHHVRDKQDLVDGVVERLLSEISLPAPELPWDERLRALGESLRASARRHPDAFLLLLRRPAATTAALRVRDAVYATLRDAGVAEPTVPRLERLLSTFMIGFAASESAGRFAAHDRPTLNADLEWALARIRAMIVPESR
jgi:AcrR family transcriptional regulator